VCIVWHVSGASLEGRHTHGVQLKFEFKNQDFGQLVFSKKQKSDPTNQVRGESKSLSTRVERPDVV